MTTSVTIKNKTAHVKQLHLGGGQSIAIPPTAEGMPGLAVTFDSDKEHERFKTALGSAVVKRWIERKEIEVGSGTAAAADAPPAEAPPPKQPPPPPPAEPPPSRGFGRRGDRE